MNRSKNKILILVFSYLITGCALISEFCPFGDRVEESSVITIVVYPKPVIVELSYENIKGSQDTVIIKDAYQHALTIAGPIISSSFPESSGTDSLAKIDIEKPLKLHPLREVVNFDFDKSAISSREKQKLRSFVSNLSLKSLDYILVEGHTDAIGPLRYNKRLSIKRAISVRNYLIEIGISKKKISIKGLGETDPVAPNVYENQRAQNRRAEIIPTN